MLLFNAMDFKSIGLAFAVTFGVAVVLGMGLIFADHKFGIKKSKKQMELEEALPSYNCGACGFPSCAGYAEALAEKGEADTTKCKPGAAPIATKIKQIMAA